MCNSVFAISSGGRRALAVNRVYYITFARVEQPKSTADFLVTLALENRANL